MSALSRQNTLFVAEDWIRIYEALENVDFRAYDFDNLVQALMSYLRVNYPEEFNDWIASSEFVTKVEILAWLSQNIAFRIDLNTRENFLATAERRSSLIRLAEYIAYKVNRVRGGTGVVKITSVSTTQELIDSNNVNLQNREVRWNDPRNEDWFEQFITIMNAALSVRTKFGKPLNQYTSGSVRSEQYVFNSIAPSNGAYPFSATVNGVDLPFDLHNFSLNTQNGILEERSPAEDNAFSVLYRLDGTGFGSTQSGFFFPIKQGTLSFQDELFETPQPLRTLELNTQNINNDDFFVQQIDQDGNVLANWSQIDTVFGEGVSFNTESATLENIYEINTLTNDRVRVRFGDGSFGKIPVGRFRFWFRTSNPQALIVNPNNIQNKTLTIPYVANSTLYYLTLTYSLQESITDSASTESNFDIRTRANKVFYTQNRMITAQDYNNFFLKDNAIRKVKSVNRTYSGHSRYAKLNDPTSLFQNVRHIAEDGRLYQDNTRTINLYSANTDVLLLDVLINDNIKPILRKDDKQILYYNGYTEIFFNNIYRWDETSIIAGQSRGNLVNSSGVPQTVGDAATGNRVYITTDSILRYDTIQGPTVSVDRVIEDGDASDGIILRDTIPDQTRIISVFPPMRNRLTNSEQIELEDRLEQKIDFAMGWNQLAQAWVFVNFDNIDYDSDFSLEHQGDTTGGGLDASWMILIEFVPGGTADDRWRITDRGLGVFIESAREVDFVFANTEPVINPETGEVVLDEIAILACNESRDSLRRRGLAQLVNGSCEGNAYVFIGDGTTTCFKTSETPLGVANTVVALNGVLQINGVDYEISPSVTGDSVCFFVAPATGSNIEIRVSGAFINANVAVQTFVGDNVTDEFDLEEEIVISNNMLAFLDGVMQSSSLDFGVGQIGNSASIVFSTPLGTGVNGVAFMLSGIDSNIFLKSNFVGDGTTTDFTIPAVDQTYDTLLIAIDGVVQSRDAFTITQNAQNTLIQFVTAPDAAVRIRIVSVTNTTVTRTHSYQFDTNGIQNTFTLTGLDTVNAAGVLVFFDGVLQHGPWGASPVWSITGKNRLLFSVPPSADINLEVFVIAGAIGTYSNADVDDDDTPANLGSTNISSCLVSFLGNDVPFNIVDVIRHDDGYVNKNGLSVKPVDQDQSGFFDNPFVFRDVVLLDGFTDLVLWRKIEEFGFDVLDPISPLTSPKGTYGLSAQGAPKAGDIFDETTVTDGDIHYDVTTDTWLIADQTTDTWVAAADQTRYVHRVGRDNLKFQWTHYAPEASRIDPSVSNVINAYILTSGYDDAYRVWLENNGAAIDEPTPPTSESLRLQFADFENFKAQSDAIVYYPARYKPLFGNQAVPELRAVFKIIQTPGSTISESDLRLRVLNTIDEYFDVNRWDFGDKFYFTELCSFLHTALAPDLQTVVIVPRSNDQAFGRLFQVRSEPDELFISAASPDDVEIVTSLTDEELRIGSLA